MKGFCACCNQEVELKVIMRNETYPVKGENIEISAQVCVCVLSVEKNSGPPCLMIIICETHTTSIA